MVFAIVKCVLSFWRNVLIKSISSLFVWYLLRKSFQMFIIHT
jgi:hypothetical protein